jgi:hypothetical protein
LPVFFHILNGANIQKWQIKPHVEMMWLQLREGKLPPAVSDTAGMSACCEDDRSPDEGCCDVQ